MPIYVSTACLSEIVSLGQRLREYSQAGLSHVELGAGISVASGVINEMDLQDGQHYIVHNYFPPSAEPFVLNLASPDEEIRTRSVNLAVSALKLSASLRAPFYSIHAGFVTDPASFGTASFVFPEPHSPGEVQFAMDRFLSALQIVLEYAEKLDMELLIENNVCSRENCGKLLLQTADEFEELFGRCPSRRLHMLLDTGHLNVSATTLSFDRSIFLDRVSGFVQAFHVHDNDGRTDTHSLVRDGSWVLDVLARVCFASCPVILESKFQDVGQLRQHVDWLQWRLGRDQ